MKRYQITLSALIMAISAHSFAAPSIDEQQQLSWFGLNHTLKSISQQQFIQDFIADYQPLFKQHTQVNQQQFIDYQNQQLEKMMQKRREMSLKQAHVRFGVINQNKDEKITLKEYQTTGQKNFEHFDKNQDGIINAEDIALSPNTHGTHDGLRIATPLAMPMANNISQFIEMYGKGKKFVTLGDYFSERDKQFFLTDRNKNMTLDEKEYIDEFMQRYDANLAKAKVDYQPIFQQQFLAMSKNKPKITQDKVKNYAKKLFKTFDSNNNKILDESEL